VGVPAKLGRLAQWRSAVSERQAVKDIENPTNFYVERYAKFVQPTLQAASA
jgi:glutathione S-transferase